MKPQFKHREIYYHHTTAREKAFHLMNANKCFAFYPDMQDGARCWIIEFN